MPGIKNAIFVAASRTLPKTRWVDRGLALAQFVAAHRRLPRKTQGGLNDALYFIKTSDELLDPARSFVTDKALVKDYARAKLGDGCNVDTIAVLDSYDECLRFAYPPDCVIKPTHMSGEVIFRRGGSELDFPTVRRWFETNFYDTTRESNYRHLRPRVIIEPFIFGRTNVEDYKIFCLHGKPLIIQIDFDRHTGHSQNLYTVDWELLPFAISSRIGAGKPKPENLDELIATAAKLSGEFNLVRIDLYTDGSTILLGEITNCHQGARGRFVPLEGEQIMKRILFGDSGFSSTTLLSKSSRT